MERTYAQRCSLPNRLARIPPWLTPSRTDHGRRFVGFRRSCPRHGVALSASVTSHGPHRARVAGDDARLGLRGGRRARERPGGQSVGADPGRAPAMAAAAPRGGLGRGGGNAVLEGIWELGTSG